MNLLCVDQGSSHTVVSQLLSQSGVIAQSCVGGTVKVGVYSAGGEVAPFSTWRVRSGLDPPAAVHLAAACCRTGDSGDTCGYSRVLQLLHGSVY